MKKGVRLVVILSFALILTFSLVSANIFTDFFNNLFGGNNRGEGVNLSPEESLAAYYSFDDGTAKDNSGNGNDGTLRNGVSFTSGILDKGKAAYFDGADDFVRVDELNINGWNKQVDTLNKIKRPLFLCMGNSDKLILKWYKNNLHFA